MAPRTAEAFEAQGGLAPCIPYKDSGLYVVPSIHNRMVFAEQVYRACWQMPFDVIAVELPRSFRDLGLVEAMTDLAPVPGVVITPTGERELHRMPVGGDPRCKELEDEPRSMQLSLMYPTTPSDSMTMAMWCPQLLEDRWPGWSPEIAPIDDEHRDADRKGADLPPIDDYDVVVRGLNAVYESMEEVWSSIGDPAVDGRRELVMASALAGYLEQGKTVLFVCGAAHWASIRRHLDEGNRIDLPSAAEGSAQRLVTAPVQSELAWLWGWLDDMPRALWEMVTACMSGDATAFDKRAAFEVVLGEAAASAAEAGVGISPRRLAKMQQLCRNNVAVSKRWLPGLEGHVLPAARACAGSAFAKRYERAAIHYPATLPAGMAFAEIGGISDGRMAIRVGDEYFIGHPGGVPGEGGRALPIPWGITPREHGQRDEESRWRRTFVPEEHELHDRLIDRARYLAHRDRHETMVRPFTGDIGLGPDWRATARAAASGEQAVYVRQPRAKKREGSTCDGTCPVVWVFDNESPIIDTWSGSVFDPDNPTCSFFHAHVMWVAENRELGEDTWITQRRMACSLSLTLGLLPARNRTRADVDSFMASYPPERLCKQLPFYDDELRHLDGIDQAIATAIKYAADHVLIVTVPEQRTSEEVLDYAAAKGVELITVSRDEFDPEALRRRSLYHSVPGPRSSVSGEHGPYDYVYRFLPPI